MQEKRHVSRFNYQRKSLHREVSVTFGRYTENEGVLYHANFSSRGLGLLKMTSQKFHQTIVMITHNNEIAQLADRIIRIEDGRISE